MKNIYFMTQFITLNGYLYNNVRVFTMTNDCENLYVQIINSSSKLIKIPFNELSLKEINNINIENNLANILLNNLINETD